MNKNTVQRTYLSIIAGLLLSASTMALNAAQSTPQVVSSMPTNKSPWEVSAAVGLTITRGNSDTVLFNLNVRGIRKWTKNELLLTLDGTYGEQSTDVTTAGGGTKRETQVNNEQIKGAGQYNRIFGEKDRWYGYGRLEALHDGIANVEGRVTASPGLGYYFLKEERTTLSAEGGPGYVLEKIGDSSWHGYMTLRLAERFEFKINSRAKIWQSVEFLPQVDDFNNYLLNAELGVSTAISAKWDLRVVLQDNYDNEPAPGRRANDLKLVAGVGFKFK